MQGRSIAMCRSHPGPSIPSATLWPATRPGAAPNTRRGTRTVTRTSRPACQLSRLRIAPVASRRAQLVALERLAQCHSDVDGTPSRPSVPCAAGGGPTQRHEAPRAPQALGLFSARCDLELASTFTTTCYVYPFIECKVSEPLLRIPIYRVQSF